MIYVGIDPGIQPTVCVLDGEKIIFKTIQTPTAKELTVQYKWAIEVVRMTHLQDMLYEYLIGYGKENLVVGIEGLAYGKKFNVALMGKIELAIFNAVYDLECTVITVPPKSWKKHIVGNGNANKNTVRDYLLENYPNMPMTSNLNHTDALGIAITTKYTYEEEDG